MIFPSFTSIKWYQKDKNKDFSGTIKGKHYAFLIWNNISIQTDRVSAGWFARQPFVTQTEVTTLLKYLHGFISQADDSQLAAMC